MTDILYDAPYNIEVRDVFVPRLKHFYFVIPAFNPNDETTIQNENIIFRGLQSALPQWAVIHIYSRGAMFGDNQPVYPEEYVVNYFTLDTEGNRIPVVTGLSEFSFDNITYAEVSA